MGEFHYSRTPASQWEAELRKMKAAGIDIVASYVMWNHHEEVEGKFDWSGNRDRRFIQLAGKAGLDVVVRVGPWAHAEYATAAFRIGWSTPCRPAPTIRSTWCSSNACTSRSASKSRASCGKTAAA
jgi:beta-galactosidase GanA